MSNLYVACELSAQKGRVLLGALQKEGLSVSEAGELEQLARGESGALEWDVSGIYQQVVRTVRGIVAQEVPIKGISFHAAVADCLLFEKDGSLIGPAPRTNEATAAAELYKLLNKIPVE